MKTRLIVIITAGALLVSSSFAQTVTAPPKAESVLRDKTTTAIESALTFLDRQQKPEGFWSTADYPGLTALIAQAYLAAPGNRHRESEALRKALEFLRANAKPDGRIAGDRMANYNTSIALATLLRAGDARDAKTIDAAHRFLIGAQVKETVNPANDGGFGYEPRGEGKAAWPDLSNTAYVLEALKLYRDANRSRETLPGDDLNWQTAIDFVSRCQQLPKQKKENTTVTDASQQGGFAYTAVPDGKEPLRAYGSMTYAGLLSFLYADLSKDDPRLAAAQEWIARNYTLEENPGQGPQGLYYYYHLMAKGLTALRVADLKTADGRSVNWRRELAEKLLSLQKPDGSWANENGRWMEKDPNLVTAYCALALSYLRDTP